MTIKRLAKIYVGETDCTMKSRKEASLSKVYYLTKENKGIWSNVMTPAAHFVKIIISAANRLENEKKKCFNQMLRFVGACDQM